ncbi:hypothetical protein HOU08_gp084 [Dickeya phage vB_DsoM_JA29]|uniref:Putative membrane protein n=2 Tax=Salmondvirus TaxID=2733130 RepID=A0A384ZW71_9CAUD|nr:hypothetical protein HOU08_gp084 [Dickeya phage vB_DsoM_JA29]AXG66485.1 putative membrane protein [Dickeya phage vB_DsoM_JA13]AXG66810.1 putative membrane protein [Dickeya phage vB_DsoM_JA29]
MEIIRLPIYTSNVPIPAEGKRPSDEPPVKYGLENIVHTVAAANIPDPQNIVVSEGTTLTAIGATAQFNLTTFNNCYPISWLNTGTNKLKFRVKALLSASFIGTVDSFLSLYNCIVINTNIGSTPYGGFLVLTIGKEGSGADLILSDANFLNGKFYASVNRVSGEF